jgi:SP family general alpha glucoside:H+ symporter-like MFS transporter
MMGAATSGPFQDEFGRRFAFGLGGVFSATGTAMAYTSLDLTALVGRRVLFLFSKLVTGFGIGVLMAICQIYVSEISPTRLRGVLLAFFPFAVVSFDLTLSVVIIADPLCFSLLAK